MKAYQKLDSQIMADHGGHLKLDVSTPLLPKQTMLINKVDYERFKSMLVGWFISRTSGVTNAIVAAMNTRNKDGKFHATASYVHNLVCKGKGFLWHRNGNMLDNRRETRTELPYEQKLNLINYPSS